jgi:hypothetical protein
MRALKKGERAVLLPGPTGAEPWEMWALGGVGASTECLQVCASPLENRSRKATTLALPVSQVFCLPIWLNATETKQLEEMIPLQLEMRGLQSRGNENAVFDWTVAAREGSRTLVTVGVLPASLPEEIGAETYDDFDLSARYLPMPENALVLWIEQDHLTAALTRGPNLVYYQAWAEARLSERILQDLICVWATLTMQGVLAPLQKVTLWMEPGRAELAALQAAWQLPLEQGERPVPRAPGTAWKLTPAVVGEAKRGREMQRLQKRGLLLLLVVYLVAVAWLLGRFFLTSYNVDQLRHWQTDHEQSIATVRETRAAWKALRPAIDENSYPLELLRETASSIPTDQLNLTLFESSDGHLLIKGEAKNVAAAFQFSDKLKHDPFFVDYTWEMGNPHPLPNDLTQFQIEGTYAPAN